MNVVTIFLIFLSLTLTCIVGYQIVYFFTLDRVRIEQKKYIRELEKKCKDLTKKLEDTQSKLINQPAAINLNLEIEEEVWADIIDADKH